MQIQNNVIYQSWKNGVRKLLFLGSTCIYPREASQPMREDYLLTSPLEYTNEPYAIAKIAGLKMCESFNLQYGTNFIAVMPTNLYGPNDNFNLEKSHVLPALIRKSHLGKCLKSGNIDAIRKDFDRYPVEGVDGQSSEVDILSKLTKYGITDKHITIWGTGKPTREFLWSEDMADACVFVMENVDFPDLKGEGKEIRNCHINIGTGKEISIGELASLVACIVGYDGELYFDVTKPDGTMKKLTDPSRLNALGWHHSMEINDGIKTLYNWYLS
jgi:GDP-L-fucose synthase